MVCLRIAFESIVLHFKQALESLSGFKHQLHTMWGSLTDMSVTGTTMFKTSCLRGHT